MSDETGQPARYRGLVGACGLGVWASGVAWLVLHYFVRRQGPFGAEASPAEPWSLKLHGAFAMLAIWTAGVIWAAHIAKAWGQGRRRASGAGLLALLGALTASGWLLYYSGSDEVRALVSTAHWLIGLCLPLAYLGHRLAARPGAAIRTKRSSWPGEGAPRSGPPIRSERHGSAESRR
jgi:hypothetical protein